MMHQETDLYREKCPYCSSENIDYGIMEPEDNLIILPKTCLDCGKDSEEVYRTLYVRTDYQQENK